MDTKRIAGSFILVAGLLVISYALFASFQIYMGQKAPPQIFQGQEREEASLAAGTTLEAQLQEQISKQFEDLLPASPIFHMMNLASWSLFAGLLIFGGAQVSGIGIKLVK